MNKSALREALSIFWVVTEEYRTINQFHNFSSRQPSDFSQQSSSSLFFSTNFFFNTFFSQPTIPGASRKNQTKVEETVESVLLNYSRTSISSGEEPSGASAERAKRVQLKSIEEEPLFEQLNSLDLSTLSTTAKTPGMDQATQEQMMQMIETVVARAMARTSRGFQEPAGPTGPAGSAGPAGPAGDGGISGRWNPGDIGFFDPNYEGKSAATAEALTHTEKDTYYKNVHVFVERVKEMAIILEANTVRRNLSFCLRGTVFMWHTAEFSDTTRRILTYGDGVDEWTRALVARFKPQASAATSQLLRERYIMDDA